MDDKSKSASHEQRTVKRINAEGQFLIEFKQKGKIGNFNKGHSCDLSATGVRFTTLVPLTKGSMLDLVLHLSPQFPGPDKVEIPVEVVRVEQGKGKFFRTAACKFKEDMGLAKEVIHDFIVWLISKKPGGEMEALNYLQRGETAPRSAATPSVAAKNEILVEFKKNGIGYKGYGAELSIGMLKFICLESPNQGSSIVLVLNFSPKFPGLRQIEVAAEVVRAERPMGKPYFQVTCRLDHQKGSFKQVIREFLEWSKNSGPAA